METPAVLGMEIVPDPDQVHTFLSLSDLMARHRAELLEAQAQSRVLQSRRRRFGGRSFLLWAEDAPERGGVLLHARDEATGVRGSLFVRDADLREAFAHFAEGQVRGLVAELGLCPEGGPDGSSFGRQPWPAGPGVCWPSAAAEPLVSALLAALLDAVHFEANSLGDEWSMRLPGLGPQPRAELLGARMGPALQLAVGVGAEPGPAPAPGQGGAGPPPTVPARPPSAAAPPRRGRPGLEEQLAHSGKACQFSGGCGDSNEVPATAQCVVADVRGTCGPPLAARLSEALHRETKVGRITPDEAGWASTVRTWHEDRADLPEFLSLPPRKAPWRPSAKHKECFGALHPLTEHTLLPESRGSRSGLSRGRSRCAHRPKSATATLSRRKGACTPALHADVRTGGADEASPGKAGVPLGGQNSDTSGPRLPASPAPCARLRARRFSRCVAGAGSVTPDPPSLNALM